jgi:hypothetical protein
VIFLSLFAGFELHIPAIENLIPGTYAGLPYTGYLGFGFLLTGVTSLAAAFSGPSYPSARGMPAASGMPDAATMAAAMMAVQQMQSGGRVGPLVPCPACGQQNQTGAKFCQACATPLSSPSAPSLARP